MLWVIHVELGAARSLSRGRLAEYEGITFSHRTKELGAARSLYRGRLAEYEGITFSHRSKNNGEPCNINVGIHAHAP